MGTIFILILAFLTLKFSKCLSQDVTKDFVKKETSGVIDKFIGEKGGGAFWYYVNFIDKDTRKAIRAQSNYFKTGSKRLNVGEEVKIKYYYNNKGLNKIMNDGTNKGRPCVEIIDDTLVTLKSDTSTERNFKVISIILFIIAGYLILSRFIHMR